MESLQHYKKEYDQIVQKKNLCGKDALAAVKKDGYALRFVKDQTLEICLEAVKKDPDALQYVKDQTLEICLEAVKQDGYALRYVSSEMFEEEEEKEEGCKKYSISDIKRALDSIV